MVVTTYDPKAYSQLDLYSFNQNHFTLNNIPENYHHLPLEVIKVFHELTDLVSAQCD